MERVVELFSSRLVYCEEVLPPEQIAHMAELALEYHFKLNPHRVPYSRPDRTSLDILAPEVFQPAFDVVREKVREHFGCEIDDDHFTGRESVLWNGTHLPVHVEPTDLSAILWLDYSAVPNADDADYNGLFTVKSPSGAFGSRKLPWEHSRNFMVEPKVGGLVIHPSYLDHWVWPYHGERPGVEIHFEMNVKA